MLPYRAFEAEDESFVVAAGNQELWRKFCSVVGREELTADPRFATQELRARHQGTLFDIVQPIFSQKPRAHWLMELDAQGIPCAPVNGFDAILADPHIEAMGLLHDLTLPNGARTTTVGFPIAISDFEFKIDRPPPNLGEHTTEVRRDWIKGRV